jgi:hypothetical protein
MIGAISLLDVIIGASLALAAWRGLRAGLTRSLLRLGGYVVGVIGGFLYSAPLAAYLETRWGLARRLQDLLAQAVHLPAQAAAASVKNLPAEQVQSLLANLGLPEPLQSALARQVASAAQAASSAQGATAQGNLGALVHNAVAVFIVKAAAFMLIFCGICLAAGILISIVTPLVRNPILAVPDSAAGALFTALGATIVWAVALGVLAPMMTMSFMQPVTGAIEKSSLATFLIKTYFALSPFAPASRGMIIP